MMQEVQSLDGSLDTSTGDDWLEDCLESASTVGSALQTVFAPEQLLYNNNSSSHCGRKTASFGRKVEGDRFCDGIRIATRPHSTPLTLKWLEENYEIAEGVCIPRSTLYLHYLDYCANHDTQPVNAASFGKIIRQQFTEITTRRLGTRGQSKYHYYGVGVKETSVYYDVVYSRKGVQTYTEGKKEASKQILTYSPRNKLGTLLPEFPNVSNVKLPQNIPQIKYFNNTSTIISNAQKVTTFLMMYRTHCQRILDTVIRANFDEVQSFLLHFWRGMPQHIVPILGSQIIIDLIGVCDSILYKAISCVLVPSLLQALPDSLMQVIRKFARQLDDWLKVALEELPEALKLMKLDMARRLGQLLKRQTSLNHLCAAARTIIQSADITGQMLDDWRRVDLASITKQTLYTMDKHAERDHDVIVTLYREFESLLHNQAPLEAYTQWLESMVDRCVIQPASKRLDGMRCVARQFLLMWSCFGTIVMRDMTLQSASSFGSFHLLHLMFDDYVLHLVESLHWQERANELLAAINDVTSTSGQSFVVNYDVTMNDCLSAGKYECDDVGLMTQIKTMSPLSPVRTPAGALMSTGSSGGSGGVGGIGAGGGADGSLPPPDVTRRGAIQQRETVIQDAREAYAHSCIVAPQQTLTSSRTLNSPAHSSAMSSYEPTSSNIGQTSPLYGETQLSALTQHQHKLQAPTSGSVSTHSKATGDVYSCYKDPLECAASGNTSQLNGVDYNTNQQQQYSYMNYVQYGYRARDISNNSSADSSTQYKYRIQSQIKHADLPQPNSYSSYGWFRPSTDYDVGSYSYYSNAGNSMPSGVGGSTSLLSNDVTSGLLCSDATAGPLGSDITSGFAQCAVDSASLRGSSCGNAYGILGGFSMNGGINGEEGEMEGGVGGEKRICADSRNERTYSNKRCFVDVDEYYDDNTNAVLADRGRYYQHHLHGSSHHGHSANLMHQT